MPACSEYLNGRGNLLRSLVHLPSITRRIPHTGVCRPVHHILNPEDVVPHSPETPLVIHKPPGCPRGDDSAWTSDRTGEVTMSPWRACWTP